METSLGMWPGTRGLALVLQGLGVQREELWQSEQQLTMERTVLSAPGALPEERRSWAAQALLFLWEPATGTQQQIRYTTEGGGSNGVYCSCLELRPWISRKRLVRRQANQAEEAVAEEMKPTQVEFLVQVGSDSQPQPVQEKAEERPGI